MNKDHLVALKAKAVVIKAHGKGKPVFQYSEHACALGYAAGEFLHAAHLFLIVASGALLVSIVLIVLDRLADYFISVAGAEAPAIAAV